MTHLIVDAPFKLRDGCARSPYLDGVAKNVEVIRNAVLLPKESQEVAWVHSVEPMEKFAKADLKVKQVFFGNFVWVVCIPSSKPTEKNTGNSVNHSYQTFQIYK